MSEQTPTIRPMTKGSLSEKFAMIQEHWRPRVAAELNGQEVKLVKFQDVFPWHHHEQADERSCSDSWGIGEAVVDLWISAGILVRFFGSFFAKKAEELKNSPSSTLQSAAQSSLALFAKNWRELP